VKKRTYSREEFFLMTDFAIPQFREVSGTVLTRILKTLAPDWIGGLHFLPVDIPENICYS